MHKFITIRFGKRGEQELSFVIGETNIAQRWARKLQFALSKRYKVDDPRRFYGHTSLSKESKDTLKWITECIDTINDHDPIIERSISRVDDQDTLNYLHSMFEQYHGQLGEPTGWYESAPEPVQRAIAELNVLVHRCESLVRGAKPRLVCTYYRMPKQDCLAWSDYDLMTDHTAFGDLCLNYCEIGKTLEDFWRDQDEYVTANTFKPFRYFSADFNVRLYELSAKELQEQRTGIAQYYDANRTQFESAGIRDRRHPHLKAGTIVVAQLIPEHRDKALTVFAEHSYVSSIELI